MVMIRSWFKSGAYGEGNNEFAHINLRSNRDEANQLQNYIDVHMYMLEPLHFGETTISWDSRDVYAKVLEWRHYKRRSKCSGMVSSINPKPSQSMIKLDVTSLENQSHVNSQVDVRRRRLYAPTKMCSICNNNLGYHIDLFGTTYDLPPHVVAWQYSMQQGITKEYIEVPLLDKEVINFGVGTFIRSVNMHHYEIWMVQLSSLKASKFGCIYVPGTEGKSVEDLSSGDIIEVPSVYAKQVECTILSPKTFMNLMKDVIHERKHHEVNVLKLHYSCTFFWFNGLYLTSRILELKLKQQRFMKEICSIPSPLMILTLSSYLVENFLLFEPILADQSLSNEVFDNDVEEEIIGILEHEIKLGNLKIKIYAPNSPKDLEENSIVMCDDHFSTYDEDVCMSMEEKSYVIHEKKICILDVSKDMMASKSENIHTQKKFGSINSIMVIVA
ncbi:hypothetical protein L7F22_000782 [Adiantum nelumboides]|nr:hypothetical protein [Adiantum nelumboides]